jgi:hypothetical protein
MGNKLPKTGRFMIGLDLIRAARELLGRSCERISEKAKILFTQYRKLAEELFLPAKQKMKMSPKDPFCFGSVPIMMRVGILTNHL